MNAIATETSPAALPDLANPAGEYLSFRNGAEEYGIDILKVQEIRGFESPTRLANAPAHLLGVRNLRGVIVPILDLRVKFGLTDVNYDHNTVTIVLNLGNQVVGMVVDAVSDVVELKCEDIKPAPEFGTTSMTRHVIGIGTLVQGELQRMLILVDIDKMLAFDDIDVADCAIA